MPGLEVGVAAQQWQPVPVEAGRAQARDTLQRGNQTQRCGPQRCLGVWRCLGNGPELGRRATCGSWPRVLVARSGSMADMSTKMPAARMAQQSIRGMMIDVRFVPLNCKGV
jgi:hypothetical protein